MDNTSCENRNTPHVLSVEGIRKYKKRPLVDAISFTLGQGDGMAVFGYNSSGKTTLLDIISGLLRPDEGCVRCTGRIGYVMQNPGFQESLSVRDNLIIEAALCGEKGRAAEEQVILCARKCGLTDFWHTKYSKCSAGMQSKLSLAAALIASPCILLLDEAFTALDDSSRERAKKVLMEEKRKGVAIVFVSHNKEDFTGLCEKILVLPDAEILPI